MSTGKSFYVGNAVKNGLLLDIATATFETQGMSDKFGYGQLAIAFYDANGNAVTPTGGTVDHSMQTLDGQWIGPSSGDASIDATKCKASASKSTYVLPEYKGRATKGRVALSGNFAPAVKFSAVFWRV